MNKRCDNQAELGSPAESGRPTNKYNLPEPSADRYKHCDYTNETSSIPPLVSVTKIILQPLLAPVESKSGFLYKANSVLVPEDEKRRNLNAAAIKYAKLVPRLNLVTTNSYVGVLVDVLIETESEVLLDEFFHLFYEPRLSRYAPLASALSDSLYKFSPLEARLPGLALCHLIHDTFMNPPSAVTYFRVDTTNLSLAAVNAHEFHRVFLATKLLLHFVRKAKEPHGRQSLVKMSVFNIYQIHCFRLIREGRSSEDLASFADSIMLVQSSIGRLMKMIFPDAKSKRLGKRGCSKYHFVGVTWNHPPSDSDMCQIMDLKPSQIKNHFEDSVLKRGTNSKRFAKPTTYSNKATLTSVRPPPVAQYSFGAAPGLSYVNVSSKFPATDFSPRVKTTSPLNVPSQSDWLRGLMYRSVHALKAYNVSLDQLVQCFQAGEFSANLEHSLCNVVCGAKRDLDENSAPEDAYLHLYLGVLTLLLPAMLASVEEINRASKIKLHASLRQLITELKNNRSAGLELDKNHHLIFMNLVQKLVHLSETILVPLPKELTKDTVRVIFNHFSGLQKEGEPAGGENLLGEICIRSIITTLNVHCYAPSTSENEKISWITSIIEHFGAMYSEATVDLRTMASEMTSEGSDLDLEGFRFMLLKLFIEAFHKRSSHKALFSELPILAFKYFFNQFDMEIQSINLRSFTKRNSVIATETFKTWWLINVSFHEYLHVISEIVTLGQALD